MIKQLLIVLMLVSGVVDAAVYKWVDSEGEAHFSDEPRRGSKKFKLGETTVYSPPVYKTITDEKKKVKKPDTENAEDANNADDQAADDANKAKPVKYDLVMKSPNQNETVRSLDGRISFSFEATPDVPKGYKLKLSIDARNVSQPVNGLRFSLGNIPLGLHQAQGWLYDASGKRLASSELVTFTLRKLKPK